MGCSIKVSTTVSKTENLSSSLSAPATPATATNVNNVKEAVFSRPFHPGLTGFNSLHYMGGVAGWLGGGCSTKARSLLAAPSTLNGFIAQSAEQVTVNHWVVGSSPTGASNS